MNRARKLLQEYFGYTQFREGQEEMIASILKGKDTLGIMPTGAGKSICYQVPALLLEGITLVISPLISLMKDQVRSLNQAGIHAAYINSSLTQNQYRLALEYARQGRYKIIYVAPERLETEEFLNFARQSKISMVTVDEAHCISQWGQDFRPSYLKIVSFIEQLSYRPIISAFTATATAQVRDDIICVLNMKNPTALTTSFDRTNLYFEVRRDCDRYAETKGYLTEHAGDSGIIYCATRKSVEEVCENLSRDGFSVTRYHAGLSDRERQDNQDDFIYDRKGIMVATNAFGMGIDKSNVRFVIHYNMPKNMESYYQEAGRAGRDGEESDCILLYGGQDVMLNQYMIENSADNEELDAQERELVKERDRERLRQMTFYCTTNDCLREFILKYFGQRSGNYCGKCGNCLTKFETRDVTQECKAILGCIGASHQRFGINVILQTVNGANTARIRECRLDQNPFYGALSKEKAGSLRKIMNYMILQDFVLMTTDQYPILKLTDISQEILEDRKTVEMKITKEEEKKSKSKTTKKTPAVKGGFANLTSKGLDLFQHLRNQRMELAKEAHVPPYVVFSDKTLIEMCERLPKTLSQMNEVSGVGQAKLEKYGQIFLDAIESFIKERRIQTREELCNAVHQE